MTHRLQVVGTLPVLNIFGKEKLVAVKVGHNNFHWTEQNRFIDSELYTVYGHLQIYKETLYIMYYILCISRKELNTWSQYHFGGQNP